MLTKKVTKSKTKSSIGVMIDCAADSRFQHYSNGVYKLKSKIYKKGYHAVALIGYGTSSRGGAFWIMRNSWGSTWGAKVNDTNQTRL